MRLLFTFFIISLVVSSCTTKPDACFSASSDNIRVGASVKFTSCSINAKNYEWDFGDGTVSSKGDPSIEHTYVKAGTYIVKLKVKNGSKSDDANRNIHVLE